MIKVVVLLGRATAKVFKAGIRYLERIPQSDAVSQRIYMHTEPKSVT